MAVGKANTYIIQIYIGTSLCNTFDLIQPDVGWGVGGLEPIPADTAQEAKNSLDRAPVYYPC